MAKKIDMQTFRQHEVILLQFDHIIVLPVKHQRISWHSNQLTAEQKKKIVRFQRHATTRGNSLLMYDFEAHVFA